MDRILVALVIVIVVAGVALAARRRRTPAAPTQSMQSMPTQLDRADFPHPERPWLLVAFTSASCHTCADSLAKARALDGNAVGVVEIEYTAHRDLHQRYRIESVPALVLADHRGVVHTSFLGRVTATDLWAAVAEAREPGSRPTTQCDGPGQPAD